MPPGKYLVVGLGELLWDMLPGGKQLGGAPGNFAYISRLLGDEGVTASRIGEDALGREALHDLDERRIPIAHIQRDLEHPTGTVAVEVDSKGQPKFRIAENVAWDFFEWTGDWQALARQCDAACFGSLAQRAPGSRATIMNFVRAMRPGATRVFDVNLRPPFHSAAVLAESIEFADIVKLSDEELPRVAGAFGIGYSDPIATLHILREKYKLKLVCLTRGSKGSVLVTSTGQHEHPGYQVKIVDTVGAGDAFTAALLRHYLRGATFDAMNDAANYMGSWVASQAGATPAPDCAVIAKVTAHSG
jgi:fructokinase